MSQILGVNTELYGSEWQIAVAAVESFSKNIVWQNFADPLGGTNGTGAEICWVGATRNLCIVRPATVDYFIQGDSAMGFRAAANYQLQWNGKNISPTAFFGNWDGTNGGEDGMLCDQLAITAFITPWSSIGAGAGQ